MTTKNKQYEENNICKIKAKPIEETNYYEIRKIIYIQSRKKGFFIQKNISINKTIFLGINEEIESLNLILYFYYMKKHHCIKVQDYVYLEYQKFVEEF